MNYFKEILKYVRCSECKGGSPPRVLCLFNVAHINSQDLPATVCRTGSGDGGYKGTAGLVQRKG